MGDYWKMKPRVWSLPIVKLILHITQKPRRLGCQTESISGQIHCIS